MSSTKKSDDLGWYISMESAYGSKLNGRLAAYVRYHITEDTYNSKYMFQTGSQMLVKVKKEAFKESGKRHLPGGLIISHTIGDAKINIAGFTAFIIPMVLINSQGEVKQLGQIVIQTALTGHEINHVIR